MKPLPLVDECAPIACTLAAADVPGRVALLERLRDASSSVERTPHGLLLRFPPDADVEPDVRRFAIEEQRCCTFWVFGVDAGASGVTLRWEGPSTTADLLDHLHRSLLGDAPIGDLAGLL